ncbi:hypothetical protein RUND412_008958 [Rhizina undulata]
MVDATKDAGAQEIDYSLANPDTITKYKDAATIAHKVLDAITKDAVEGATILSLCEKGDKMLEEETAKVYKGKKISKGLAFPTTVSPNDILTPYTPLSSVPEEAETTLKAGDLIKIQLGAHIDGFPAIVSDNIVVGPNVTEQQANLILANHYCTEALLRLLLPPALHPSNTEEKPYKPPTSNQITQTLSKIAESFGCKLIESTTSYALERNEIEGKKRIVVLPSEGIPKSDGTPEIGDAWGVEVAVSTGSGKLKEVPGKRPTLHRKTETKFMLKRPTGRETLNEVTKKFGTFPFSMRQLDNERNAKVGMLECVRHNVFRQFEVLGEKESGHLVARSYVTVAITKNGIVRLTGPPALDLERFKTDKKIEDEEILKLLDIPLKKDTKRKKKPAKKEE